MGISLPGKRRKRKGAARSKGLSPGPRSKEGRRVGRGFGSRSEGDLGASKGSLFTGGKKTKKLAGGGKELLRDEGTGYVQYCKKGVGLEVLQWPWVQSSKRRRVPSTTMKEEGRGPKLE